MSTHLHRTHPTTQSTHALPHPAAFSPQHSYPPLTHTCSFVGVGPSPLEEGKLGVSRPSWDMPGCVLGPAHSQRLPSCYCGKLLYSGRTLPNGGCSGLRGRPQKIYPCPRTCECDLTRERGLCRGHGVKDLEMKPSCIFWEGSQPKDQRPCKRQRDTQKDEEAPVKMEAETRLGL